VKRHQNIKINVAALKTISNMLQGNPSLWYYFTTK